MSLRTLFTNIEKIIHKGTESLSKEEIAAILNKSPEVLDAFEKSYYESLDVPKNFLEMNAKQAVKQLKHLDEKENQDLNGIIERIVYELLLQSEVYTYDGKEASVTYFESDKEVVPVSLEEIKNLPEDIRPQLAGMLMKKDISGDSCDALLYLYKRWKDSGKKDIQSYHMFRQGLDILDLDPLTYKIIDTNPNSIGNWFPQLVDATKNSNFFKLPQTSFIKVPLSLLQLTRLDYGSLTPSTLKIVDEYCQKVFSLDKQKEYFIKTGTYSSKFDFRNAYVHGEKEVMELGEYLLYIHFHALQMASPLCTPCIYGMSTTNEWVVREFIPDKENNPCIYKGLPLHTEYRVFVDFDTDEILGVSPYWKPDVMKNRFGNTEDADDSDQKHDYVIYSMHERVLMNRYNQNKDRVCQELESIIRQVNLSGQWSVDIMQNGSDYYIIDMALAYNSALKECVPEGKLKIPEENWIPKLMTKENQS